MGPLKPFSLGLSSHLAPTFKIWSVCFILHWALHRPKKPSISHRKVMYRPNKLYSYFHSIWFPHAKCYVSITGCYSYRSFATRVSQLQIWHFWIIGIERNVCRCTFNRCSVITQFAKLAAGEQLCRRALVENYSTSKPLEVSPKKSHILSCDSVIANGRYHLNSISIFRALNFIRYLATAQECVT
jgi:hypothetical protein